MDRLRFGIAALWFAICFLAAGGFAQSIRGAVFAPAPALLEQTVKATPRQVTAMDLLALRDPEGLSISPDGEHVAFVIGQAVYEINGYRSGLFVASTSVGHQVRSFGSAGLPHWDEINQWIPEAPEWSPDSKMIWYRTRMNG